MKKEFFHVLVLRTIYLFLLIGMIFLPLVVSAEQCPKYDRSEYGGWIDADKDCQITRSEVLIEESVTSVTFKSGRKCVVVSGIWNDPFSGRTFSNPSKLDIDHVVPLREAHQSGAWKWSRNKKKKYANYMKNRNHLMAVFLSENRSKGYRDPAEWLPLNKDYWKTYARIWIEIKNQWGLSVDKKELDALKRILGGEIEVVYPRQTAECVEVAGNPFAAPASITDKAVVKKSKSGLCHDQSSKWYNRTKSFTAYDSVEECLSSGGRLPGK
jgi:hypothetical protein